MTTTFTTATNFTALAKKDLHFPPNDGSLLRLRGAILKARNTVQAIAASATNLITMADHDGILRKLVIGIDAGPGTNEVIAVDLTVNGSSVLTTSGSTAVFNSTSAAGVYDISSLIAANTAIKLGDIIKVAWTYTAGTPNHPDVFAEVLWY